MNQQQAGNKARMHGKFFKRAVVGALTEGGWAVEKEYDCGFALGSRKKKIKYIKALRGNEELLVVCQYQDARGSAMEKIPYKYMCFLSAVEGNRFKRGLLVLGGEAIESAPLASKASAREMEKYMRISPKITIVNLGGFEKMVKQ